MVLNKKFWIVSISIFIALLVFIFFAFKINNYKPAIQLTNSTAKVEAHQSVGFNGKALVIWTAYNKDKPTDVYAQLIDDQGNKVWGKSGKLISETQKNKSQIKLGTDKKNAYITWIENQGNQNDIYMQKVDSNGDNLWSKPVAVAVGASDQSNQQVYVSDKGVLVAWQDYSNQGQIRVQLFDKSSGKAIWNEPVLVARSSYLQAEPRIIELNNNWVIVWQQQSKILYSNIYAQKINDKGQLLWDNAGIELSTGEQNKEDASIVADNRGGFYVVWEHITSKNNIFAQHVSEDGKTLWNKKGIQVSLAQRVRWHPTALFQNGKLTVAWKEENRGDDVYAQQLSDDGKRLWGDNGLSLSSADYDQSFIASIDDKIKNNVVVVWQDARNKRFDVFGQVIDSNGKNLLQEDGQLIYSEENKNQIEPLVALIRPKTALVSWIQEGKGNMRQVLGSILRTK